MTALKGVPVMFGVVLWRNRNALHRNKIKRLFGFLYLGPRELL